MVLVAFRFSQRSRYASPAALIDAHMLRSVSGDGILHAILLLHILESLFALKSRSSVVVMIDSMMQALRIRPVVVPFSALWSMMVR